MTDRRMPSGDRILLVEGQDDKHVVLHICERQQYTPPYRGTAIKTQELDIYRGLANTFFNWLKDLFDLSPL